MTTQSDNGDDALLDEEIVAAPLMSKPMTQRKDSCSSYSASGSCSSDDAQSSDSDSDTSHKSSSSQGYKSEQQQGRKDEHVDTNVSRRSVLGLRTRPPKRVCIQTSGSEDEPSDRQSNGSDYVLSQSEKSEDDLEEESGSRSESAESIWSDEYLPKKRTVTRQTKKKSAKVWDSDPDTYGVWRSSRTRKLPSRYTGENDSDSEYDDGYRKNYRRNNFLVESSEEDSGDARRRKAQWKKFGTPVRSTGRKKEQISYKEQSSGDGSSGGEYEFLPGEDYYYEEEQDNRPTVEKVLQQRTGKIGDIGAKTAYWRMNKDGGEHDEGDEEDTSTEDKSGTEVHYLIKWLGYSHLHNTWETEDSLTELNAKGIKKLHNFMRREEDKEAWLVTASKEDIEYFECQDEMSTDLLEQHKQVERVIASRRSDDGSGTSRQEYFCKWKGLPYSECTWDDSELVSQDFQEQIDSFIRRHNSDCIPTKSCKVIKNRPKFRYMKEQPPYIGRDNNLVLRDYQLDGLNWLACSWCKENSVILADEMGLGKTIQSISFLSYLYHSQALYGPFLLVVPLSTMASWQKEFNLWAPEINAVVYLGDVSSRNIIKEYELIHENKRLKFNALLTTYEILLKDASFLSAIHWAVLLVDEAHRLKNEDSQLYTSLKTFTTNHRILITGTPLQNSLKELWALLHFIMQKEFSNCAEFESDYGGGDAASLGKLHQRLEPYLLRRIKKDVEKSLPAKVEQILRVEMSSIQKKYYKWILTKNYKALSKGLKGSTTSFVNIVMELKKCCNHASLIRPIESSETMNHLQSLIHGSGKLFLLDKLLCRLKEGGHRVLIFSQMVMMLDVLAEYLQLRHFNFQRLDGSIRGELRKQALDHFNAEGSQDFCFLLSTRAGGLGVNLATADTVIIFDSDWNPQNDLQAQARAHRIGQKKQVNIYRLITSNSIEEDIIERAKKKMVLDHLVIQRMDTTGRTVLSNTSEPSKFVPFSKEELNAVLKFGAEDLFKETVGDDKALQEMDLDEILKRAETQESDPSISSAANELLSQFNVTSFAIDDDMMAPVRESVSTPTKVTPDVPVTVEQSWDEIIPEDVRAKIKEEEELEEQLQLYLPPRQRRVQNYAEDRFNEVEKQNSKKLYRRKAASSNITSTSGKTTLGFTDAEIRRFIKSYRKFGDPCSRLQEIAADASLNCKQSQLKKLAQTLHASCVEAEQKSLKITQSTANGKKQQAVTLKLGGVTVNCQSILRREEELAPLALCIPKDPVARKRYRMVIRPKPVRWGVPWSAVEDSKLLVGLYEHGMGNWVDIKQDKAIGLQNKILPRDQTHKPQAKELQTRVEYLLKLLQTEAKQAQEQTTKSRVTKKKGLTSKKQTTIDQFSGHRQKRKSDNSLVVHISLKKIKLSTPIKESAKTKPSKGPSTSKPTQPTDDSKQHSVCSEIRFKTKAEMKAFPVIHGSPAAATAVHSCEDEDEIYPLTKPSPDSTIDAELDSDTFLKCKEILRPEKKSLSQLQNPSEGLSKEEKLTQYKKCLVKIGDCISQHVKQFTDDEDALQEWNSNLWIFVSKFTSASAGKLYKIYRKAKKNLSGTVLSDSEHQKPVTSSLTTDQEKKEAILEKSRDEDTNQHTRGNHHYHHRDRSHSHERSTSQDRTGSSSRRRHHSSSSTGHHHHRHHHHRHHDHHRHSSSSRDDRHYSSSRHHHHHRHHSPSDRYHRHHHHHRHGSSSHHHHHHKEHDFSPGRRRES